MTAAVLTPSQEALALRHALDYTPADACLIGGVGKSYVSRLERNAHPREKGTRYLAALRTALQEHPCVQPYRLVCGDRAITVLAVSAPAALRAGADIPEDLWTGSVTWPA